MCGVVGTAGISSSDSSAVRYSSSESDIHRVIHFHFDTIMRFMH